AHPALGHCPFQLLHLPIADVVVQREQPRVPSFQGRSVLVEAILQRQQDQHPADDRGQYLFSLCHCTFSSAAEMRLVVMMSPSGSPLSGSPLSDSPSAGAPSTGSSSPGG